MKLPHTMSLEGNWRFTYTPPETSETAPPEFPPEEEFSCLMPVPGYWDDHLDRLRHQKCWSVTRFNPGYRPVDFPMGPRPPDGSLPYLLGTGWYRRRVTAPEQGRLTLHVEGVVLEAWVWIDGRPAGYHLGHSTSFDVSLDALVMPGRTHELTIAVCNTRTDRNGSATRGFHGKTGGMRGPVCLRITGGTRIAACHTYPAADLNTLTWKVLLDGPVESDAMHLDYAIKVTETGTPLCRGTVDADSRSVAWSTDSRDLHPWCDREPHLYDVEVTLRRDGATLDVYAERFGLRSLERDGMVLRLNGRPVYLRGACEHFYFPETCTAPTTREYYRGRIRAWKALGFNWLRCHTWVPPREYLDAADELGMLVQVEAPVGFGEQEWIDILAACRKHPCVVIYCCGNETTLDEAFIERLRTLAAHVRELVPDALFNPQEALHGVASGSLGPDAVIEPYPHNPKRLEAIKSFSDVLGHYAWGDFSYRTCDGDWRHIDAKSRLFERPCLTHEVGITGNYINLDLEQRYEGTRIGPEMYTAVRRYLRREGLLSRAPLYYKNSCALQRLIRKNNLETVRKCRTLAGFDYLGAMDTHWHRHGYPCGILNEFQELKPGDTVEQVLRYNAESVLLLDCTPFRNLKPGDDVSLELMVSLFGADALDSANASWVISDDLGHVQAQGTFPVKTVRSGQVDTVGTVRFTVPGSTRPTRLRLSASVTSTAYHLTNAWDFWVFPVRPSTRPAVVATPDLLDTWGRLCPGLQPRETARVALRQLAPRLDADSINCLGKGGRVILLGCDPFPSLPTRFEPACAGRALGNLATVIEDHWITRPLPHEGFCDWPFYPMMQDGRAVVFNDLPLRFDPIIEIVSAYKLVKKQAALFELTVGPGRLIVCSFNLTPADPASVWLLHRLLDYAARTQDQPAAHISVSALEACLGAKAPPSDNILKTDEAFDIQGQV